MWWLQLCRESRGGKKEAELAMVSCRRVRDTDARCSEVEEAGTGGRVLRATTVAAPARNDEGSQSGLSDGVSGGGLGRGNLLHGKPSRDFWLCWTEEGGV